MGSGILGFINANKGVIVKRGLIAAGAAVGLLVTYGVLKGKSAEDECDPSDELIDEIVIEDETEDDSDEE